MEVSWRSLDPFATSASPHEVGLIEQGSDLRVRVRVANPPS